MNCTRAEPRVNVSLDKHIERKHLNCEKLIYAQSARFADFTASLNMLVSTLKHILSSAIGKR